MTLKAPSIDQRQQAGTASSESRWQRMTYWLRVHHWVGALAGYTVITLALTFPLILHLGDSIMGPVLYGDSLWYTWYPYAFRQAVVTGQDPSTTHLLYALLPHIQLFAASDINGAMGALLLSFMVPLAVFNILTLINFILSGLTTYLLVNEFVPNRWAAFIAGSMYTFSTYHFWRVLSGLSLTSMQWMPLVAWRVFAFYRRPTWGNAVWMGLSLAMMPLSDLYLSAYFLPIFALVFVAGLLVANRAWLANRQHLLRTVAAFVITVAISLPLLASSLHVSPDIQAAIAAKTSSTQNLSANLLAYFFPSPRNPLFGAMTLRLYRHMPFKVSEETAGYLGWVALALAGYGLLAMRKRSRALYFWVVLAIVAFVISLGPALQVGGHVIVHLPFYELIYGWPILSNFRAPNRMAPVVLMAVCVVAAYGLDRIFALVRTYADGRVWALPSRLGLRPRVQMRHVAVLAVGVVVICASLAESIQFAVPYPFTHVPVPAVYEQMAADPVPGLVLTLPIYPKGLDMYYQTIYHRGLVTGYPIRTTFTMERTFENIPGVSLFDWPDSWAPKDPYANVDGDLRDVFPLQETLLQGLQRNHIRYVVLRYDTTGLTQPFFPQVLPWMKPWLEQQLGAPFYDDSAQQLTVWRIDPAPVDPTVTRITMGDGWLPGLKIYNGEIVRGILQDAQLTISVPQATTVDLTLTATAVGGPQTMAVSINGSVVKALALDQPGIFQTMDLGVVQLHAGDNVLHFAGTQRCVDPGANFPATLNPNCLMFQVAALQMNPEQA